jgi:hypothetical protein
VQQALVEAAARRAHAFGGTGAAVEAALSNETFIRQAAQTAAQLRQSGYDNALAAAQADAGRAFQAQTANQAADRDVARFNAEQQGATGQFNAQAQNQMAQFNANLAQAVALQNAQAANAAALDAARGQLSAAQGNQQTGRELSLADAAAANQAAQWAARSAYEAQTVNQQAGLQAQNNAVSAAQLMASLSGQERAQALQDIQTAGQVGDAQQALAQRMNDAQYEEFIRAYQDALTRQNQVNAALQLLNGVPILNQSHSQGRTTEANNDPGRALATALNLGGFGPLSQVILAGSGG